LAILPGALATLLSLAMAAPGHAQNLIPTNPEFDGFDAGFPGWETTSVFPAAGEDADGCPDSGSFRAESDDGSIASLLATECLEVETGDTFHLEVAYRSDVEVYLRLAEFSNPGCSTGLISALTGALPASAEWTTARVEKTIENVVVDSVRFQLAAYGGAEEPPFVAEFDRAYLGRVERVFEDDFEGGEVCRWSDVVDGLPL
jgi:hypothetical protein